MTTLGGRTRPGGRGPLGVAVVVVLLVWAVPASAQGFGEVLDPASPDVVVELKGLSASVCYIDGSGSGSYSAGDPVILDVSGGCSGNSASNDLRLSRWEGHEAGRKLAADRDSGKPLSQPNNPVAIWYYDADGDGRLGLGDTVYANLQNPTRGFVDPGDVRLTAYQEFAPGETVQAGDADLSLSLRLLGAPSAVIGYVDTNTNDRFDSTDLLYINSDQGGNEIVEFGDVRLVPVADDRPFGSFVVFGDGDGGALLTGLHRDSCYTDRDGSGTYGDGDGLYLTLTSDCSGTTRAGDIRLVPIHGFAGGSRLALEDPDAGAVLQRIERAEVLFSDDDADGVVAPTEAIFLDVVDAGAQRLGPGDVRLSLENGTGMVRLDQDSPEVGRTVTRLGALSVLLGFVPMSTGSTTSTAPRQDEPVYLNVDGGGGEGVEPGDVRLVQVRDLPPGGRAVVESGEVLPRMNSMGGAICVSTSDTGSSTYSAGDGVYLSSSGCTSEVPEHAIRLVEFAGRPAGTLVRVTDSDHHAPMRPPSETARLRFFDADGDGDWSLGDTLYVDLVGTTESRVGVGDVRVTGYGAVEGGSAVLAMDPDNSLPLVELTGGAGRFVFIDADSDGLFGGHDQAYVNVDGSGQYVTVLDVRLNPLTLAVRIAEPTPDPQPEPSPSVEPEPEPQPEPQPEPSPPDVLPGDEDNETDENETDGEARPRVRTPGPAFPFVVLTLAGLLAVARRRR